MDQSTSTDIPLQYAHVRLCGLFSFNKAQKEKLEQAGLYHPYQVGNEQVAKVIKDLYYPHFRPFILNNTANEQFLKLTTGHLEQPHQGLLETAVTRYGAEIPWHFSINQVELCFFEELYQLGLFSLAVSLPTQNNTISNLTKVVGQLRNFQQKIIISGEPTTVQQYIEKVWLHSLIKITGVDSVDDYSGAKMKSFVLVDTGELPEGCDAEQLLFDLATLRNTEYAGQARNVYDPAFYRQTLQESISVFKNWTALCLFDTFTVIGHNSLAQADKTWENGYFNIYLFNLYFKYYLFKINSDLTVAEKLPKSKSKLESFLTTYNFVYISYNFLPNLLHKAIRKALYSEHEAAELRNKIDRINNHTKEANARELNNLLLLITLLSLVSVIKDLPELVENIAGKTNALPVDRQVTWISMVFIFFLFVLFARKSFVRILKTVAKPFKRRKRKKL